jgi:RimJ/RimL family protein N-acetyltransferase
MSAFADPLIRTQSAEAIDSPEAAERWIAGWTERWDAGSAFAFAVVDAAGAVLGNVAVGAVAGFGVEGLQRQKLEYDGQRHDVELHARLASDEEPSPR